MAIFSTKGSPVINAYVLRKQNKQLIKISFPGPKISICKLPLWRPNIHIQYVQCHKDVNNGKMEAEDQVISFFFLLFSFS